MIYRYRVAYEPQERPDRLWVVIAMGYHFLAKKPEIRAIQRPADMKQLARYRFFNNALHHAINQADRDRADALLRIRG